MEIILILTFMENSETQNGRMEDKNSTVHDAGIISIDWDEM